MNELDWLDWVEDVTVLAVRAGWNMDDSMGIAYSLPDLYEQGDTPEEAIRKYQEGEV